MRLSRAILSFLISLLAVLPAHAEPKPPVSRHVVELQVSDSGTWYVIEEAVSGKTPVRFLSAKRNGKTTHFTVVPVDVADRWLVTIKAEVIGKKPLLCAHPRRLIDKRGRDVKTTDYCAEDFSTVRRRKLQSLSDEMQSRLKQSGMVAR